MFMFAEDTRQKLADINNISVTQLDTRVPITKNTHIYYH